MKYEIFNNCLACQFVYTNDFSKHFAEEDSILIIDSQVYNLYNPFPIERQIILKADEIGKSLQAVEEIYQKLIEFGASRKTMLYGIGGGIVCDITGFAGATFMRGMPVSFVPTTLLSQADASIGGKNGVNFHGMKNIVGTIVQPQKIIFDPGFLNTLTQRQIADGYAEIIKIAAVMDFELFEILENISMPELADYNSPSFSYLMKRAINNKIKIVCQDEYESGYRRILNFGHTLAHAIEPIYQLSHGSAVSIGMIFAAELSIRRLNAPHDLKERLIKTLKRFGLPVERRINPDAVIGHIRNDKKKEKDFINFVLLNEIGSAVTEKISIEELSEVLHAMY
jgi:3-dehydroquinate synthase